MTDTMTKDRSLDGRHAGERENTALLIGLVTMMVVAVLLGALAAWGLRQHHLYGDAQDQIARLSEGQDAAQSELAGAESTIEDLRTFRASQDARLGACQRVVHVSHLQRAVATGDVQVRAINRYLRQNDLTYDDLWDACRNLNHEEH